MNNKITFCEFELLFALKKYDELKIKLNNLTIKDQSEIYNTLIKSNSFCKYISTGDQVFEFNSFKLKMVSYIRKDAIDFFVNNVENIESVKHYLNITETLKEKEND